MSKWLLWFIGFLLGILASVLYFSKVYAYEYTPDDLYLVASVTYSEAGNQSELGQRLVADTIFNRVDSVDFPNTVSEVIFHRGQYTKRRLAPPPSTQQLVAEELYSRTNPYVLWFRTGNYHTYGTPLIVEGSHYFSGEVDYGNDERNAQLYFQPLRQYEMEE